MDLSKYKGRVIGGHKIIVIEFVFSTLIISFNEVYDKDGSSMLVAERWLDDIPCPSDHFTINYYDDEGDFTGYETAELDDSVISEIKAIFDEIGVNNI